MIVTLLFINAESFGIGVMASKMGYEDRLFDDSRVHSIDIVIDDWESFLQTAQNEEYSLCTVVIDGEAYRNVAIRAKGNTSLSSVVSMGSSRYSFKVEFDHYDNSFSYHGLDKLSLNNLIQDNTMMKDYLAYKMMGLMGTAAPLCSYAYITVNGEDHGLYLAVEGIEDSFLTRNFGSDHGELYKPDSMGFGGGRGNGKNFDMNDFALSDDAESFEGRPANTDIPQAGKLPGGFENSERTDIPEDAQVPENFQPPEGFEIPEGFKVPEGFEMPEKFEIPEGAEMPEGFTVPAPDGFEKAANDRGGFGGMGSSDVKLQYTDDNPESYGNIFNNAKTDIDDSDKSRLIASLKRLSEGENIEDTVDIDSVIRYFAVHDFLCNGDSYTGSMVHNYYLYEENGILSMIPWDYNLAFGGFNGSNAESAVNSPIDSPVSGGSLDDRPMAAWIFKSEEYTEKYHVFYNELITAYHESGYISELIDYVSGIIAPFVEKDPTKFCTFAEFEKAAETIKSFCELRAKSVRGQLDGTIPSTEEGQKNSDALIGAEGITISDMGSMGNKGGGMNRGGAADADRFQNGGLGQNGRTERTERTERTQNRNNGNEMIP